MLKAVTRLGHIKTKLGTLDYLDLKKKLREPTEQNLQLRLL